MMFGIRGLDPFGLVHASLGVVALILGLAMLLRRKGTSAHRKIGYAYVLSMVLLNITALMIFDLSGTFGPFHVASIISLASGAVLIHTRLPGMFATLDADAVTAAEPVGAAGNER